MGETAKPVTTLVADRHDTAKSVTTPVADTTKPVTTLVADTIEPVTTLVGDTAKPVTTLVADTAKPVTTLVADTTKPVTTLVADMAKPVTTLVADTAKPITTLVADPTEPITTLAPTRRSRLRRSAGVVRPPRKPSAQPPGRATDAEAARPVAEEGGADVPTGPSSDRPREAADQAPVAASPPVVRALDTGEVVPVAPVAGGASSPALAAVPVGPAAVSGDITAPRTAAVPRSPSTPSLRENRGGGCPTRVRRADGDAGRVSGPPRRAGLRPGSGERTAHGCECS